MWMKMIFICSFYHHIWNDIHPSMKLNWTKSFVYIRFPLRRAYSIAFSACLLSRNHIVNFSLICFGSIFFLFLFWLRFVPSVFALHIKCLDKIHHYTIAPSLRPKTISLLFGFVAQVISLFSALPPASSFRQFRKIKFHHCRHD